MNGTSVMNDESKLMYFCLPLSLFFFFLFQMTKTNTDMTDLYTIELQQRTGYLSYIYILKIKMVLLLLTIVFKKINN